MFNVFIQNNYCRGLWFVQRRREREKEKDEKVLEKIILLCLQKHDRLHFDQTNYKYHLIPIFDLKLFYK